VSENRPGPVVGQQPSIPLRAPRWPIALVRTLAVVILLQVLIQAALAGGFITGRVSLLGLHSANGILLVLTSTALPVLALLLLRPGRGPWWPIAFSVALWFLIAVQVGFGFARLIGLHIPIGVTIMGLISGFTWWSMLYRPGTTDLRRAEKTARTEARRAGRAAGHAEREAAQADPIGGHARPEPRT
jgi:hypothetical protein